MKVFLALILGFNFIVVSVLATEVGHEKLAYICTKEEGTDDIAAYLYISSEGAVLAIDGNYFNKSAPYEVSGIAKIKGNNIVFKSKANTAGLTITKNSTESLKGTLFFKDYDRQIQDVKDMNCKVAETSGNAPGDE